MIIKTSMPCAPCAAFNRAPPNQPLLLMRFGVHIDSHLLRSSQLKEQARQPLRRINRSSIIPQFGMSQAGPEPQADLLFDIFEFVFSPVGLAGIFGIVAFVLLWTTKDTSPGGASSTDDVPSFSQASPVRYVSTS